MQLTKNELRIRGDEIAELLRRGMECWIKASEALCALIDSNPTEDVIGRIANDIPDLTPAVLRALERVGRKQLLPQLLLKDGPGWNRLKTAPLAVQKRYLTEPVELLVSEGKISETLRVGIGDLTPRQARQAFSPMGTIRDLGAQRAVIESERSARFVREVKTDSVWRVVGRSVHIYKPTTLSVRDIGMMMAEIKS